MTEKIIVKTLEVDKEFLRIEFDLSGKKFSAVVDQLIKIKEASLGDIPKNEIEFQLEASAYYQATFIGAMGRIKDTLDTRELEYKIWYSEKSRDAATKIVDDLNDMVEEKKITKGNVKPPVRSDIENWIISNHTSDYRKLNQELSDMRNLYHLLGEYLSTFRQRGNDLRALLKNESGSEGASGNVYGGKHEIEKTVMPRGGF